MLSNAEIHSEIAKRVYPDEKVFILDELTACYAKHEAELEDDSLHAVVSKPDTDGEHYIFNLLETDSNGKPTQQAKASSLDVFVWITDFNNKKLRPCTIHITSGNPCAAIFEAAKNVIDET